MRFTQAFLTLLALSFGIMATADDRPNVVIMLADNLGWGDLSVYNQGTRGFKTPNLDKLAGEGLRLTQFGL